MSLKPLSCKAIPFKQPVVFSGLGAFGLGVSLLFGLMGCSSGSPSQTLQDAFAADPRLKDNANPLVQASPPASTSPSISPSPENSPANAQPQSGALEPLTDRHIGNASTPDRVMGPQLPPEGQLPGAQTNNSASPIGQSTPNPSSNTPTSKTAPIQSSGQFPDIEKAPPELRRYVQDLAQLGILTPSKNKLQLDPNQPLTRRDYARWLVTANNRLYTHNPARQIRLGLPTSPPAFQDVLPKDADFAMIQGLAETGLIPSPLSGDTTSVLFRPDAPLTREELILWKLPVDTRQVLPNATIEAVKKTWGFQDADHIEAKALKAVLADFQNGDQANIRRAFAYTTLFQPKRAVTRAEAAAVLWSFGFQGDGLSAQQVLQGKVP